MKKVLIQASKVITLFLILVSALGYYYGAGLELKLSLTDLLPKKHPAVVKFEKLTEVVGGVGYFTILLTAEDETSHLKVAPKIVDALKKSDLVRSVFFHREQRFFIDRLLYYVDTQKLTELAQNIDQMLLETKRSLFDIGLWEKKETEVKRKPALDDEIKQRAKSSAKVSPYLISSDNKKVLVMIKPSFDSMDLSKTKNLIAFSEKVLEENLPAAVSYDFAERYYSKVLETKMIETDIFVLGSLSILLIAGLIYLYLRSFRGLLMIFIPVFLGMGITLGITRLMIGHINIITGFLMGIVSGLGVDYGIHLLLRLQLEREVQEHSEKDPIWRTLASSGHSVFVGAMAASVAFFLLCFSSFRAFSEFGFVCGVGIAAVFVSLITSFAALAKFLKQDEPSKNERKKIKQAHWFPTLSLPKGFFIGVIVTFFLGFLGLRVSFEYDFNKMLQHSKKMEGLNRLVDKIYDRSSSPSALSAPTKEEALAVENLIKTKYMPHLVGELISGASIVPEDQKEKQKHLKVIETKIRPLKDKWIERSLDIPAHVVKGWVAQSPFQFSELPSHVQDSLRGTQQKGYLLYLYPAVDLSEVKNIKAYAAMIKDIEQKFPNLLTGSDVVIFSDILDLINRDGAIILVVIFLAVGLFIWASERDWRTALLSYLPLLISLPVGMGLMTLFGVKFNIFNIAIIPTFVAMGIDVPIHIVHRTRELGSGYKAAKDLAMSINLALMTAAVGFGVLIFARAGVLKSLGWIALLGTAAIWWIGLFILPAFLEKYDYKSNQEGAS